MHTLPPLAVSNEQRREDIERRRQLLRQRLISERSRTYTYKDPDAVATRAGATIDDDGTIILRMGSGGIGGGFGTITEPRSGGGSEGPGGGFGGFGAGNFSGFGMSRGIPTSPRNSFVAPRLGIFESLRRRLEEKLKKLKKGK